MKTIWKVLSWITAGCGIGAFFIGWTANIVGTTLWLSTEFWFFDAISSGIFAIFFLVWGALEQKEKVLEV